MNTFYHPDVTELSLPEVLNALSDPIRLIVVKSLAECEEKPCGTFQVPVAKSTLSHHLRVLREAGITKKREEGTQHFISLRREDLEARFPGVLDAVLRSVRIDEMALREEIAYDGAVADD